MATKVKRERETADYAQFAIRGLKAYGRRVGGNGDVGDVAELKGLADFAAMAERITGETVAQLRSEAGGKHSWAEIAASLGISRSAAQHRYEKYGIAS